MESKSFKKYLTYKDILVARGSRMYELLTSIDPIDKVKAEAHYKEIFREYDKYWPEHLKYLQNYPPCK